MQESIDIADNSMSSLVDAFFALLGKKTLQGNMQRIAKDLAIPKTKGICTIGMGGSSIAGQIAISLLKETSPIPLHFARDYRLPGFVDDQWTVIAVSYSGNTEETLSAYNDALSRGAELFTVTTGGELGAISKPERTHLLPKGIQPRAALPMILAAVLPLMEIILGRSPTNFKKLSKKLIEKGKRRNSSRAPKDLAKQIHKHIPVFVGWRHLVPVAYRAKTQINENAKLPSYSLELPEANHNEIEAAGAYDDFSIAPILLRSEFEETKTTKRFDATCRILEEEGIEVENLAFPSKSKLEEVLLAIQYLDDLSVCLSKIRGVNPMDVPQISLLKAILGGDTKL